MQYQVGVGSKNPGKLQAVQQALDQVWPQDSWQVTGYAVDSGVSDQPMSDVEAITGARNRAQAVLKLADVDYAIGLEGGIDAIGDLWFDCGWIVVLRSDGVEGVASSSRMIVPSLWMDKISGGLELGEVVDEVFDTKQSKHNLGHFGLMTNGHVSRIQAYSQAIIFALTRFLQPQQFESGQMVT